MASKVPAIILSIITFGAAEETYRILTSNDDDIVESRSGLWPMAVGITAVFLILAVWFWVKALRK